MNIKFYNVQGLNRFDTINFTDIHSQHNYFEKNIVSIMGDESFYPPYYQNKIKVDTFNDLFKGFKTETNYLSFEYNDKVYYYFIDNINYINEDLIELDITMDTIQTYMFDIDFLNVELSKKSIKRYLDKDGTINRNYIRKNYSQGVYKLWSYEDLHNELNEFICVKFYDYEYNDSGEKKPIVSRMKYGDTTLEDGSSLLFFPNIFIKDHEVYTYKIDCYDFINKSYKVNEFTIEELTNMLHDLTRNAYVIDIFMVNLFNLGEPFGVYYDKSNKCIEYNLNDGDEATPKIIYTGVHYVFTENGFKISKYSKGFNFGQVQNTDIKTPFDYRLIPQLIDTNYIDLHFGERSNHTLYPLNLLTKDELYLNAFTNPFNNERVYSITDKQYGDDKYLTTIVVGLGKNLQIINDKANEFNAFNSNFNALIKARTDSNNYTMGWNLFKQWSYDAPVGMASQGAKGFSQGSKMGGLVGGAIGGIANVATSGIGEIFQSGSYIVDTAIKNHYIEETANLERANASNAPDSTKQSNTIVTQLVAKNTDLCAITQYVSDIKDVAKIYEGYGYDVHESYSNYDLFKECNIRYYYNIVQCSKINIHLHNCINDNATLLNIIDRFKTGLRLWNVTDNMFNLYTYDNVENDFI